MGNIDSSDRTVRQSEEVAPATPDDVDPAGDEGRATAAQAAPGPVAMRFNWSELSGSLGDLGTFLPLTVAMTIACGLDLGIVLVVAGLANLLAGFCFRQPIPVQPMKAIAAVAIAERMAAGEIAAAGFIMGVAMLFLSGGEVIGWIVRRIPKAIVWGIQVGVGAKLALTGLTWLTGVSLTGRSADGLDLWGWDSILTAVLVAALFLLPRIGRTPLLLLAVFVAGFGLLWLESPDAWGQLGLTWPSFTLVRPTGSEWQGGLIRGALPQLPLTLLNSVVAVCALSADYFPGRGVAPRRMARNLALVNLFSAPIGGIPMCYGAGGLAAQWRFGARTGGSVIMLGVIKITVGLLFGATLVGVFSAYPRAILAVMIIFAGAALASSAKRIGNRAELVIVASVAVPILVVNVAVGFLAGVAVAVLLHFLQRPTRGESSA